MREQLLEESALADDMPGSYVVSTEGGTEMHLDLDARTVRTFAGTAPAEFRRRNREIVDLVLVGTCRIGEPMVLLLDLGIHGVWFTRRTTEPVTRIVRTDVRR